MIRSPFHRRVAAYNKATSKRWAIFIAVALLPRVLGAITLPNAFGDAYVYIQEIGNLTTKISDRSFRLTDLFGFWLPLYQFTSTVVNLLIKNGFYSGKVVAALFGAGACLLVYLITRELTKSTTAATWMFMFIALNPLHIFYSASAMTDVPHAFFVLAALYFVLSGNWIAAAVFGALAGLTRVESWMLIALIPFIQFVKERRISIVSCLILTLPPLFWFYISWKATGNWLACFVQRQQYHDWLLRMNPSIAHFSVRNVLRDLATLLVSSDVAVLMASLIATWFVLKHIRRLVLGTNSAGEQHMILAPVIFFGAFFGLLSIAYLTHQQPIIFPRYGLILFTLGLPILAWAYLKIRQSRPRFARRALIAIVLICLSDGLIQFAGAIGTLNQYHAQRTVADHLRDNFNRKSDAKIFCDDGTVRVLSGISEDRFVTSAQAPNERAAFLTFLDQNQVEYLVIVKRGNSIPARLFADDLSNDPEDLDFVMHSYTDFLATDIWVYRVKYSEGR